MINMWEYLIKNGYVVDGTGAQWYRADIAIAEGKIADINRKLPASKADTVIDAKGLVVSPGFVDMHNHSEYAFIAHPTADSMIHQGVTTMFTCHCGGSGVGPFRGASLNRARKRAKELWGVDVDWTSLKEYLERFKRQGCSVNGAFQIGQGTLRQCVMDYDNRAPTKDELDEMKALIVQAMDEGAFGMSSGLMYAPGGYAETDEIIELAKVVGKKGGIHMNHIRRKGWESDPRGGRDFIVPVIDSQQYAVKEIIKIADLSGCPTTWVHSRAFGAVHWNKSIKEWYNEVVFARRSGIDIGIDVYPYTFRGREAFMPTWALEGGPDKLMERLKDPTTRRKIKDDLIKDMEGVTAEHTWDKAIIQTASDEDKDLIGKNFEEAAKMRGTNPTDLWLDKYVEGKPLLGVSYAMHDEDVKTSLKHPLSMFGSDGSAIPENARVGRSIHPRWFGTFTRILRKYVREERVLTLEDAIRKLTSAGITKLGIMDRGLLRPGFWADVTVFDPLNVTDLSTISNPRRYSKGLEYVFVNGVLTLEHDEHTGALAGKPLLHRSTEN